MGPPTAWIVLSLGCVVPTMKFVTECTVLPVGSHGTSHEVPWEVESRIKSPMGSGKLYDRAYGMHCISRETSHGGTQCLPMGRLHGTFHGK